MSESTKNTFKSIVMITVFTVALIGVVSLISPEPTFADSLSDRINQLSGAGDETDFLNRVVQLAVFLSVLALIGLSVYAGFTMLTSSGNPEKINEAREILLNAFLGFGLIALSVAILVIIDEVLNLPGMP